MKLRNLYLLGFVCTMILSSCEKVIDLDLENAEPIIVIEGNLSDQEEQQTVKISSTYDFSQPNKFNALSNANVVLSSDDGETIIFEEDTPGIYKSDIFKGISGHEYTLRVTANGQVYTAISTMPPPVRIDSLNFTSLSFFGEVNKFVGINYSDSLGFQNQYRYILSVKNKIEEDNVTEDRFNDGNEVSDIIFFDTEEDAQPGDTLDIELQGIDRNVYKYFFAISQIEGNGGPPVAPANPDSNFSNGALGIFSAHTRNRLSIINR